MRTLLLALVCGVCVSAHAQSIGNHSKLNSQVLLQTPSKLGQVPMAQTKSAPKMLAQHNNDFCGNEILPTSTLTQPEQQQPGQIAGVSVGTTEYDLQTNSGACRRVAVDANGTAHITWTKGAGDFNDRGTGYNTVSSAGVVGTIPTARLEDERSGWSNIGITSSGRIINVAHRSSGNNQGLKLSYKDAGSATWTVLNLPGTDVKDTWPRMAISGNTVHIICSKFQSVSTLCDNDLQGALTYYRSTDGGTTWSATCLDGMTTEFFSVVGGDTYSIDANGNNVSVVVAGAAVWLIKSTDGGNTWADPQLINAFPQPLFSGAQGETLDGYAEGSDASPTVIVDGSGVTHIWYGYQVIADDDEAAGYSYYPDFTAIAYWHEGMDKVAIIGETVRQDYDGDTVSTLGANSLTSNSYFTGGVTSPSAALGADGTLYIAYPSVVENDLDASGDDKSSIFIVKSNDGGATWCGPFRATSDANEAYYPSIARNVGADGVIHLVYQSDPYVGVFVNTSQTNYQGAEHPQVSNNIQYVRINSSDISCTNSGNTTGPQLLAPKLNDSASTYSLVGYQNCLDVEAPDYLGDALSIDYPDGGVLEFTYKNINPAVPGVYEDWGLGVEDSDGNFAGLVQDNFTDSPTFEIIADTEPPVVYLKPYYFIDVDGNIFPDITTFEEALNSGLEVYIASDPLLETVQVLINTPYNELGADGLDFISFDGSNFASIDCPPTVTITSNVNTAQLGTYEVVYTAVDVAGNEGTATRTVQVVASDNEAPILEVYGPDGSVLEDGAEITLPVGTGAWGGLEYAAFDNIGGYITGNVVVTGAPTDLSVPGVYTVTYTVTDASGNNTTTTVTITVADTVAPVITVIGPAQVTWPQCSNPFNDPGANATDTPDGNITANIVKTYAITCGTDVYTIAPGPNCLGYSGTYVITYNVSDAAGNQATPKTRNIIVPSGSCSGSFCDAVTNGTIPDCVTHINGVPTAVENHTLDRQVTISPVPTQSILNVATTAISGKVNIAVYDIAGRLAFSTNREGTGNNVFSLDLSGLSSGVYFVKVSTPQGIATHKAVIE